ncbi:protein-L-isoaspartate O-methyltransferase family protein [Nonomuraea lactucae]|uniref:protein-L-isoaspartate O-methyltransferase family protein n=1 Tax=Nonomuraea lactucae TaxID=2249762 RepID=UPI000DE1EAA0|nr:methyltransferase domain-containing protein [Nonomuraea lactucae]
MNADVLSAAVAAVPREHYTDHPELGRPPQTTAQKVIERDIARTGMDLAGKRVLEVGTGTGYTGALLAELVGPEGQVVSIDIDLRLVERARKAHAERGCPVTVAFGDGHDGAPDFAPFDLIIGWCTPTYLPGAWLKQVRPGGVISTPIYIAPVARTVGHLRATATDRACLADVTLTSATYVDMGSEVNTTLGAPLFYVDAVDGETYVSVAWRDRDDNPAAALALLNQPTHVEVYDVQLDGVEAAAAWRDARAYFAARDYAHGAASFSTWGSGAPEWDSGFGFTSGRNTAMIIDSWRIRANTANSPALAKLHDYLQAWENAGRLGIEQLDACVTAGDRGWEVRATLPAQAR